MQFSVIIPTFNRLELLKAALRSVQEQTVPDFEVIVVDDGSTDGTTEWARTQSGVRVMRQDNAGPSAARNLGARHATGNYLAFLDSDDLFFPDALATYAQAIAAHAQPALLIGAWIETRGFTATARVDTPLRCSAYQDYFAAAADGAHFQSGSGAVRRDCFERAGGFSSALTCAEDQDLALRLGTSPGCVVIDAPAQVIYRRHEGSLTANVPQLIAGATAIIANERANTYPGGDQRRAERRAAILRLAIPVSVAALRIDGARAWQLFRSLAAWALSAHRWKYLLGFPLLRLRHAMTPRG